MRVIFGCHIAITVEVDEPPQIDPQIQDICLSLLLDGLAILYQADMVLRFIFEESETPAK
jgi:hypothetical protein